MDFKDQIKGIGERVSKLKDSILTEEATKMSFIVPFIQCLGYDVFNPFEVSPEYVTDVGIKKGEKIDYAIMKDGSPIILVECKHHAQNLDLHDGQLLRYFHVSKAKFGILTNGIHYRFYSDLDTPNKMDEKPFLEINITDVKEQQVDELKKFHKSYFNVDEILNTASELKYLNEIKAVMAGEFSSPSEAFVRHFANKTYSGKLTSKVMENFTEIVKKASQQFVSDIITERLKSALAKESTENVAKETPIVPEVKENKVETTAEELEAFLVVKAILRSKVAGDRIFWRDAQSYFSVLLDDNNRKPICRFYLSSQKKIVALFDSEKKEVRYEIKNLDEIYKLSEQLCLQAEAYERMKDETGTLTSK